MFTFRGTHKIHSRNEYITADATIYHAEMHSSIRTSILPTTNLSRQIKPRLFLNVLKISYDAISMY